jgi:membrane protein
MAVVAIALGSQLLQRRSVAVSAIGPSPEAEPRSTSKPCEASPPDGAERGRLAATPEQIPARGWKDIAIHVWREISRHRILAVAAGVTFYALLAIFPFIAAMVAIYSLFADPSTIGSHLETLSYVLPAGALSVIGDQIGRIAAQGRTTLGVATIVSLAVVLWSAKAGMKAVFDALNIVYQEEEKRGFFKLNAVSLGFTLCAIVLAIVAIAAVVALPPLISYLGLPQNVQDWINWLRWPLLLLSVSLAASVIYRYGPSRREAQWRWLSWGAALFAIGWLAASLLFSWYTTNFGTYNETYGSLGTAVGFMTWMWITNIALLLGAEINAETEHQTARDTTKGGRKPLGARRRHGGYGGAGKRSRAELRSGPAWAKIQASRHR